jgi:hypothetical protein
MVKDPNYEQNAPSEHRHTHEIISEKQNFKFE